MFARRIILLKNASGFYTYCCLNASSGKVMNKIMTGSKKKFQLNIKSPVLPFTLSNSGKTPFEAKVTGNKRRTSVLNKVFMRYITDLMATGQYSNEILGHGIEVNKVKISADYKFLKVYWIAKESADYDAIELILKKNAGALRHELSQLRVMGEIPTIVFVKDKIYSAVSEVESRLAKADFGDEYEITDDAEKLKIEYELFTALDTEIQGQIPAFESKNKQKMELEQTDIPLMPQNVLGLDHADVLKRVKKGMKKSEATHRITPEASDWLKWSDFKKTQPINSLPVNFVSHKEQHDAFRDFLQKRQILKMREKKGDKNWTPDREYIMEELRERWQNLDKYDSKTDPHDYIDDEYDERL